MPAMYSITEYGSDARRWRWALLGLNFMVRAPGVSLSFLVLVVLVGIPLGYFVGMRQLAMMLFLLAVAGFAATHVIGLALTCLAPPGSHSTHYARAAFLLTLVFLVSLAAWGGLLLVHGYPRPGLLQRAAELTPWLRDETFERVIGVTLTINLGMVGVCWLLFLKGTCGWLNDSAGRNAVQELLVVHLGFTALIAFFSMLVAACFVVMLLNPITYFWHLIAVAHVRDRLQAALRGGFKFRVTPSRRTHF